MTESNILQDDWGEDHRSGVVAIIGRPNVGKSTLINAILGQKIAITTPKPQTTRRAQLGILTTAEAQILFNDTPGLHRAANKLGEYMYGLALDALRDSDVNVWIVDASEPVSKADQIIAQTIKDNAGHTPTLLVLNKIDRRHKAATTESFTELIDADAVFEISATQGTGIDSLLSAIVERLPLGPRYYPVDQVSDQNMRFIAAEVVREKVMLNTEQEIPHAIAVEVTEYAESNDEHTISAIIYVERDSQKGIIIGKGGQMIKTIGTQARHDLMAMLGDKVHLDLHVKVLKNWRSDEKLMKRVGYRLPKKDE